jgi:hypothetical protein
MPSQYKIQPRRPPRRRRGGRRKGGEGRRGEKIKKNKKKEKKKFRKKLKGKKILKYPGNFHNPPTLRLDSGSPGLSIALGPSAYAGAVPPRPLTSSTPKETSTS